jgi:hypothetical protein
MGKDISGLTQEYLFDELKKQRQFRQALEGVNSIVDGVDKKDAEAVVGAMRELYERMFADSASSDMATADMVGLTGSSIKFKYSPTSLVGIDKFGGLIESGLSMVLGSSGRGKTHMATQWALHNHDMCEGSTCLASWEQGKGELRSRVLSNRSEVDLGKITLGTCSPEELLKLRLAEAVLLCGDSTEITAFCTETRKLDDKTFWDTFWGKFKPRDNRLLLFDAGWNFDDLFVNMELMVQTRNVKFFLLDYPEIVPVGRLNAGVQPWQYKLDQIGRLKNFCRRNNVRIVFPAQYGEKDNHIKYNSGAINYVDLAVALTEEDGDKEYGPEGALTCKFLKYRNYSSPDGTPPKEFKVLKSLSTAKFLSFDF